MFKKSEILRSVFLLLVLLSSACSIDPLDESNRLSDTHDEKVRDGIIPEECLNVELSLKTLKPTQIRNLVTCMDVDGSQGPILKYLNELKTEDEDLLVELLKPINRVIDQDTGRTFFETSVDGLRDLDEREGLKPTFNSLSALLAPKTSNGRKEIVSTLIKILEESESTGAIDELLKILDEKEYVKDSETLLQLLYETANTDVFNELSKRMKPTDNSPTHVFSKSLWEFFRCSLPENAKEADLKTCRNELKKWIFDNLDVNSEAIRSELLFGSENESPEIIQNYNNFVSMIAGKNGEGFLKLLDLSGELRSEILCGNNSKINNAVLQERVFVKFTEPEISAVKFFHIEHPTQIALTSDFCDFSPTLSKTYPYMLDVLDAGHFNVFSRLVRSLKLNENIPLQRKAVRIMDKKFLSPFAEVIAEGVKKEIFTPILTLMANLSPEGKKELAKLLLNQKKAIDPILKISQNVSIESFKEIFNHFDRVLLDERSVVLNLLPATRYLFHRIGFFNETTSNLLSESITPEFRTAFYKASKLSNFKDAIIHTAKQLEPEDLLIYRMAQLILFITPESSIPASPLKNGWHLTRGNATLPESKEEGISDQIKRKLSAISKNDFDTPPKAPQSCRELTARSIKLLDISEQDFIYLKDCLSAYPETFEDVLGDFLSFTLKLKTQSSGDFLFRKIFTKNSSLFKGDMPAAMLRIPGYINDSGVLADQLNLVSLAVEKKYELADFSKHPDTDLSDYLEKSSLFRAGFQFLQSLWLTRNGAFDEIPEILAEPSLAGATEYIGKNLTADTKFHCDVMDPDLFSGNWPDCFEPHIPYLENPSTSLVDKIKNLDEKYEKMNDEEISIIAKETKFSFENNFDLEGKEQWSEDEFNTMITDLLTEFSDDRVLDQFFKFLTEGEGIDIPKKNFHWRPSSERLAKFLIDHTLSPDSQRVILYWYPGESEPRPKIVTDLDQMLLLIMNGDVDITGLFNITLNSMYDLGMAGKKDLRKVLKSQGNLQEILYKASKFGKLVFGKEFRRKMFNVKHNIDVLTRMTDQNDMEFLQGTFIALIRANKKDTLLTRFAKGKTHLTLLIKLAKVSWLRALSFMAEELAGREMAEVDLYNRKNRLSDFKDLPLTKIVGFLSDKEKKESREFMITLMGKNPKLLIDVFNRAHSELLLSAEGKDTLNAKNFREGVFQLAKVLTNENVIDNKVFSKTSTKLLEISPNFMNQYLPQMVSAVSNERLSGFLRAFNRDLYENPVGSGADKLAENIRASMNYKLIEKSAQSLEEIAYYAPLVPERFVSSLRAFVNDDKVSALHPAGILSANFLALSDQMKTNSIEPDFQSLFAEFFKKFPIEDLLFMTIQDPGLKKTQGFRRFFDARGSESSKNIPLLETEQKLVHEVVPLLKSGRIEKDLKYFGRIVVPR